MSLKEKLISVKTTNETDQQTIREAIELLDAIEAYNKKQNAVFALLGYIPKREVHLNEQHENNKRR